MPIVLQIVYRDLKKMKKNPFRKKGKRCARLKRTKIDMVSQKIEKSGTVILSESQLFCFLIRGLNCHGHF